MKRLIAAFWVLGAFTLEADDFEALSVEISDYGDPIYVRVPINGTPYWMLPDTGTSRTTIDGRPEFQPLDDGKSVRVNTSSGPMNLVLHDAANLGIGKGTVFEEHTPAEVLVMPTLRNHGAALGRDIAGVLGMDVLSNFCMTLDFDAKTLTFSKSSVSKEQKNASVLKDLEMLNSVPGITLRINGQDVRFALDTGANAEVSIPSNLFGQLEESGAIKVTDSLIQIGADGNRTRVAEGILSDLRLGEFELEHLEVELSSGRPRLGLRFLARFLVEFNFPESTVQFVMRETSRRNRPRGGEFFGLDGILFSDGFASIQGVDPEGLLGRAGFQSGDVILAADQSAIGFEGMDLLQFLDYCLQRRGESITLNRKRTEGGREHIEMVEVAIPTE